MVTEGIYNKLSYNLMYENTCYHKMIALLYNLYFLGWIHTVTI